MSITEKTPIDVVRSFLDHMARGEYTAAMKFVSDDCEYINPPPLGAVHGRAGMRALLEPFFAPTLENDLKVLRESSSGDVVFVERLDRHRLADKWVELPVTGVFEIRSGEIKFWRDYFDASTILSQWPTA